jgi:hypothetical protein
VEREQDVADLKRVRRSVGLVVFFKDLVDPVGLTLVEKDKIWAAGL